MRGPGVGEPAERNGPAWRVVRGQPTRLSGRGLQAVGGRDHRCWAFVDGVDDLGVIDPTQIDRRDREVSVPELALNDEQRHAFARHLHRVGVSELMRREPASHTRPGGSVVQLRSDTRRCPRATGSRTAQHTEQSADRQRGAQLQPWAQLLPGPRSIPTSRRLPPLPRRTRIAPRCRSRSLSLSARASLMRQPGTPEHDDQPAQPHCVVVVAGSVHDGNDLFDCRRVGRIALTLVARRSALVKARQGGGRPASHAGIQLNDGWHASSLGRG
jgi:hypothetical protein